MDNNELIAEIEDRIAGVFDEVITDLDNRIEEKVCKRLNLIETYLKNIVELFEITLKRG